MSTSKRLFRALFRVSKQTARTIMLDDLEGRITDAIRETSMDAFRKLAKMDGTDMESYARGRELQLRSVARSDYGESWIVQFELRRKQ